MSKSSFYRKIKLITDLSPVEFVKNIRLKACIRTFRKGGTSLESVAYSTGFSSAKYFPPVLRNSSESPRRNFYVGVNWMSDGRTWFYQILGITVCLKGDMHLSIRFRMKLIERFLYYFDN
mgnify:CR=1 FL=1